MSDPLAALVAVLDGAPGSMWLLTFRRIHFDAILRARNAAQPAAPAEGPSCCELACYEDPGCTCDGCQPPAPAEGLDVERLAPLLAVEFGKAGFFLPGASLDFLTQQARLMLEDVDDALKELTP